MKTETAIKAGDTCKPIAGMTVKMVLDENGKTECIYKPVAK